MAPGASAQTFVLDGVDEMDFDRPESWALKYFASVTMMTGLGVPKPTEYGSIALDLELGWIPSLSEEQRRVGFVGSKDEDLNRNSVFGRLRATFGLPRDFSITVGVTPPIERNGVTPRLLDLSLARPVYSSAKWRLGLRLYGQLGTIEGDFICPEDIAGLDDPEINPDDCHEPSRDEATVDFVGLELSAAPKIWGDRWEPYLSVSGNYMDLGFQVNARYSVFDDRTKLVTDGMTFATTIGLGYAASEKLKISGELFYSPLEVVRSPTSTKENDGLLNVRFLFSYSFRLQLSAP